MVCGVNVKESAPRAADKLAGNRFGVAAGRGNCSNRPRKQG